jgi:hypothetical protein
MTTVTHSYNQSGTPDADDKLTREFLIDLENGRRTAFNSTTPPPTTPLAILPKSTQAERKSSVEVIINALIPTWWSSYVTQAREEQTKNTIVKEIREAAISATPAQRAAGLAALKA